MKDSEEFFQVMTSCVEVKTDIERDTSDTPHPSTPHPTISHPTTPPTTLQIPFTPLQPTTIPFHPTPPYPPNNNNNPLTLSPHLITIQNSLHNPTTSPQPMPDTPYTSSSASPPLAKILHQEPI
ncbi:hypothetical protein Pmani_037755 [Petrolisthes manimaculis]|uniref:Uncharacterized protein n=1 Tax=Petrolisthes manimaculis TaxID=1843537 RepID=A0AAE1TKU9_9EUCA|nr:hypothetical protein Pmani_037755 [Petrolisthes manimaculis]